MDKELLEQFQMLTDMMGKMQRELEENRLETRKTQIMIENEISNKISALFDGYKLTHEKQYELERKADGLERRVLSVENRIA